MSNHPCPKGDRSTDARQSAHPGPETQGIGVSFRWYYISCSERAPCVTDRNMTHTLIGYARCSTDKQDLAAQKEALLKLGVAPDRIYTDHGFTGTNRERPGLDQALAAVRSGDTLVVPKLDRLARSVPDARAIGDSLAERSVKLQIGSSVYDPNDPMGKLFFNILATFAEFEADLIKMRTREGMAVARAKGKLRGKKPKLSDRQQKELRRMYDTGDYSISDLAELFSISRPTVYRTLGRQAAGAAVEA
ncbi:recombinase family protein [Mesorhizobium sp.]|uniref:recombinase family protein n=1 Tax=Mesorhizobium sp. TaxID=1871066 RepID=UPI0025BBB0D0|nr:recombinase family protein [Mesorhizobium sp.]